MSKLTWARMWIGTWIPSFPCSLVRPGSVYKRGALLNAVNSYVRLGVSPTSCVHCFVSGWTCNLSQKQFPCAWWGGELSSSWKEGWKGRKLLIAGRQSYAIESWRGEPGWGVGYPAEKLSSVVLLNLQPWSFPRDHSPLDLLSQLMLIKRTYLLP